VGAGRRAPSNVLRALPVREVPGQTAFERLRHTSAHSVVRPANRELSAVVTMKAVQLALRSAGAAAIVSGETADSPGVTPALGPHSSEHPLQRPALLEHSALNRLRDCSSRSEQIAGRDLAAVSTGSAMQNRKLQR
jgi:hypothetical protein